jgi:DNA-binding transcriptional MerR regulator
MRIQIDADARPPFAIEQYQPKPNILYTLDAAAHIAGVPRRSILIYCRAGLVQSVIQPPYGVMAFTEEAILTVRRIEHVRTVHGTDLTLVKALFNLLEEVERLRNELRFLRQC